MQPTVPLWSVYIVQAEDGRFYSGITTDPSRRMKEHSFSKKGAKFFRQTHPKEMRVIETGHTRSSALKVERKIKGYPAAKKRDLFFGGVLVIPVGIV